MCKKGLVFSKSCTYTKQKQQQHTYRCDELEGRLRHGRYDIFLSVVKRKSSFTFKPSRFYFLLSSCSRSFSLSLSHFVVTHNRSPSPLSSFHSSNNIWLLANPCRIHAIDKTRLPIKQLVLLAFQITPIIILITCSRPSPTW